MLLVVAKLAPVDNRPSTDVSIAVVTIYSAVGDMSEVRVVVSTSGTLSVLGNRFSSVETIV